MPYNEKDDTFMLGLRKTTMRRIKALAQSEGVGQEVIIMWGLDVLENKLWLSRYDSAVKELRAICKGIPSGGHPA